MSGVKLQELIHMLTHYTNNNQQWLTDRLFLPLVKDTDNVLIVNWWKDIVYVEPGSASLFTNFSSEDFLNKIAEYDSVFIIIFEVTAPGGNSLEGRRRHRMMSDLIKKLNEVPSVHFITFSESSFIGNTTEPSRTFSIPWFHGAFYTGGIIHSPNFTPDIKYLDKDYTFSMLLGKKDWTWTRDIMFDRFKDIKDIYKTYYRDNTYKAMSDSHLEESFLIKHFKEQDISSEPLKTFNRVEVPYDFNRDIFISGVGLRLPVLSHIVPEKIYKNTHFDIISETNIESSSITGWASEKTGRSLVCGRFLIWQNCANTSLYLKKFGYELDSYALNDYDKEINPEERFWKVIELIEELNNINYVKKVYEDTREARIHNIQVAKDGMQNTLSNLQEWIKEALSTKI